MGKYIVGVCEGGELLCREAPLPRAPSPKRRWGGGTLGGEAASLREAPLPPDPSLPKSGGRLTWGLLHSWFRLRGGASPIGMATCWRWGNEPLRPPMAGTSPFRGGFAGNGAQRLPPQRELLAVRLTEDKPLRRERALLQRRGISSTIHCCGWSSLLWKEARGGGTAATSKCFVPFRHDQRALRSPFGNLRPITPQTMWYPTLAGRGGSVSRRDRDRAHRRHAQLAGGTNDEERINSNASRFPEGSAREGPFSERPPPSQISHVPYFQLLFGRGGLGERRFS